MRAWSQASAGRSWVCVLGASALPSEPQFPALYSRGVAVPASQSPGEQAEAKGRGWARSPCSAGASPHVPLSHPKCLSPPPFRAPRPGEMRLSPPSPPLLLPSGRASRFHGAAGLPPPPDSLVSWGRLLAPGETGVPQQSWGDWCPSAPQVHHGPDSGWSRRGVCGWAPRCLSGAGSPGPSRSSSQGFCRLRHGFLPVPPGPA